MSITVHNKVVLQLNTLQDEFTIIDLKSNEFNICSGEATEFPLIRSSIFRKLYSLQPNDGPYIVERNYRPGMDTGHTAGWIFKHVVCRTDYYA